MDIGELDPSKLSRLPENEFRGVLSKLLSMQERETRENAILYYQPVSEHARAIHLSTAQTVGVGGGNGSSKTESCIADIIMCCTGQIPLSLAWTDPNEGEREDDYRARMKREGRINPREKLKGPLKCRIVCESLTTVLHPIILPKLQWWKWTGVSQPGGEKGHWGWVPRDCLIGGQWEKSWSEKLRMLKILYRDPMRGNQVIGESTVQFMSKDQDSSDFASGDFNIILHDEPPTHAIWRENQARTMRVAGRMMLAMTWPDDPAIAVDWLFDKVYEPAMGGDPNIEWINLYTTDNPNLDHGAIAIQMSQWTDEECKVRIRGEPIRFSNRVHSLFTDQDQTWCFPCGKSVYPIDGKCNHCESLTIGKYNHVEEILPSPSWPTVYLLDPHPRKPHMMAWWQISPQDDLFQVAEAEVEGDPTEVKKVCDEIEGRLGILVTHRYIDPNMGKSPASSRRGITWQDEFQDAGLMCDLADDSGVGRKRIDEYLKPDPSTLTPRIHIARSCHKTVAQMKRYVWDDYKKALERDLKQIPKSKNDDFPTLLKYLMNTDPTFHFAKLGSQRIRRMPGHKNHQRKGVGEGRFSQSKERAWL